MVQYYSDPSKISTNSDGPVQNWVHLPQCQSTNDVLLSLLGDNRAPLPEGFVLSTDFQTEGRGQRGNSWESEPNENLMFSLVLYPSFLGVNRGFWLSASVAIAVASALKTHLPEICVKWPNDLMVNGLKIGGLLIENTVSGKNLDQSVIGIGLNVNQLTLPSSATSLARERHTTFDREKLMNEIVARIFEEYHFLRVSGWEKVKTRYFSRLYKMAVPHLYRLPDGTEFRAVLQSVSDDGELVLLTSEGDKHFRFKEVSFL